MPSIPMTSAQIVDDLAARIMAGEYTAGQRLPSYAEFADLYSVSVSTVSRAVAILRDRGLVVGVQGRGLYVQYYPGED